MNILLIGAGLIGIRHAQTILEHPDCTLVGIVDPNPESCRDLKVKRFSTLEEVDVSVDGAIIATPTSLHKMHAEFAAKKGWHILIEKPVAGTIEDADDIVNIAKKYKIRTLVGHHRRYHNALHVLKKALAAGKIGTPILTTLLWAVRKPDAYFENNWRSGEGSPVMINLVHDVDVLRFLFGDVEEITAMGNADVRQQSRIESGLVSIRFENGLLGSIAFSDTCPSPWGFEAGTAENPNIPATHQDMMYICGTQGSISFPSLTMWQGSTDWSKAPTSRNLEYNPTIPLNAQLDHFLDVIGNKTDPIISAEDGKKTLEAALLIEKILSEKLNKETEH